MTSIGADVFANCEKLESIKIPDSVTSIEDSAFYSCFALSKIIMSDNIVSIGREAFCNCSTLPEIIIPCGVYSIDEGAFDGCRDIICKSKHVYGYLKSEYGDIVKKDFDDSSNESYRRKLILR